MDTKLLGIYLNDHLAGSVVGVELAKRAASNNEGSELGDFLAELAEDIEEDRDTLKSVMNHFGVTENRVKMPIAWAAEKVGRLKPNGQITGYSPLSRLIELEGLALGVTGKLALWRSLAATQIGPGGVRPRDAHRPCRVAAGRAREVAHRSRPRGIRRPRGDFPGLVSRALDALQPKPPRHQRELFAKRLVSLGRRVRSWCSERTIKTPRARSALRSTRATSRSPRRKGRT